MPAWSFLTKVFSYAKSIDWSSMILGVAKTIRGSSSEVEDKFLILKPHALSDDNVIKAVSVLRLVLSFVPHPAATLAGPLMGLGVTGFNLWKRMSASKEFDLLKTPLVDINIMRAFFSNTPALSTAYPEVLKSGPVSDSQISKWERIYNDISFITDSKILQAKYPEIDASFLEKRAARNAEIMQKALTEIQQEILKVSKSPETDANIKQAFSFLMELFPAMQSWVLFNSKNFDSIVEIIDTVV